MGSNVSDAFAVFDQDAQSFGLIMYGDSGVRPVVGGTKEDMDRFNESKGNTSADIHAALMCAKNEVWPMFDFYKRSFKG